MISQTYQDVTPSVFTLCNHSLQPRSGPVRKPLTAQSAFIWRCFHLLLRGGQPLGTIVKPCGGNTPSGTDGTGFDVRSTVVSMARMVAASTIFATVAYGARPSALR